MDTIRLNNETWQIDLSNPLGGVGGFGEVFYGKSSVGNDVAIKRLKITAGQAAHREMNIGNDLSNRKYNHVVPILDSGLDAETDRYYLVMPVCEQSLQDKINSEKQGTEVLEAADILLQILIGLEEVNHITHRDLKPGNILFHEGQWKLADFGIAKFVEDSTSLETLRESLTPLYAAPEQWLGQRPTEATDIYAVACIAHVLATGSPPFKGDRDSIRESHLNVVPDPLPVFPARVRSLISLMLRKTPETRPSRSRCIDVLRQSLTSGEESSALSRNNLIEAVSTIAATQSKMEAAENVEKERMRRRDSIFNEAVSDLKRIKDRLFQEIFDHARDIIGNDERQLKLPRLSIGKAVLAIGNDITSCDSNRQGGNISGIYKNTSGWDIVAFTHIRVEQNNDPHSYMRSANLIYAKPPKSDDYRWYEISFFSIGLSQKMEPYFLQSITDIDMALSPVMGVNQHAHAPVAIDGEDEDNFISYWIDVVSQAALGNLRRPSQLPIQR